MWGPLKTGFTVSVVLCGWHRGRGGCLMVSTLHSGLSALGSSPGRGYCVVLCSWARHFHVYKSIPANLMLGVVVR